MKLIPVIAASTILLAACATQSPTRIAATPPPIANAAAPEPGVFTSGRFGAGEVGLLPESGVRHVIDLTHHSEAPDFDAETALRSLGIRYDRLPIRGADGLTRANVEAFDRLLAGADEPVLVHCGSSNRVGAMAALRAAWIQGKSAEEAIAIGRAWGLTGLESAVRERL